MRREGTEPTLFAPGTEGSNLAPSTSESCANLTSSPSRWGPATGSPLCEASRRDLNREWPEGHPVAKHVAVRWMTTGGLAFTFNDLSRRKPPVVPRQDRGRPTERPAGRGSPVIADCGKLVPRSRLRQARGGWMRRAVVNQGPLSNHGHHRPENRERQPATPRRPCDRTGARSGKGQHPKSRWTELSDRLGVRDPPPFGDCADPSRWRGNRRRSSERPFPLRRDRWFGSLQRRDAMGRAARKWQLRRCI